MRKRWLALLAGVLSVSMFVGSTVSVFAQDPVRVGGMKGPTTMGLVNFMNEEETDGEGEYTFQMVTAADELTAAFASGDVDIALVPANMASVLYHKTEGKVQVIDINTLGVLYMVTADDSISSIADLSGKTVYTTGKGQTPEFVLNYLLEANGISKEDVTVEFKSEATEVVSALVQDETAIGILPQPFATVACKQNENLKEVCDLTKEWDATGKGTLVTGVTIAKKDYIEANPEIIDDFLEEHKDSIEEAVEDPAATAELVAAAGIVEKAPVAEAALAKCNLKYIDGEDMKTALSGYLEVLLEQGPDSIGGNLPGDDFYYISAEEADD